MLVPLWAFRENSDPLHARTLEYFDGVWRVGQLARQILPGEMELFVEPGPPLGAIGDVVDDPGVGHEAACPAFSGVQLQLAERDDSIIGHVPILS